ncbi:ABC-type Fe3+-siderophore transport system, permease component [Cryptosporangium arvum DSM 44712]|uniref:ABC-type Fe3+-siderophore transport system, permease component n=2 Tax=Cryptosporangium TaxID=65502 RepID=A0A010YZ41_9ACTN|nr:ABC-type Fe3+-siderophore transport system, permease component [Cryptosporangium arvum DSM 44712]
MSDGDTMTTTLIRTETGAAARRPGGPPFASPRRFAGLLGALTLALLVVVVLGVAIGAVRIAPGTVLDVIAHHLGLPVTGLDPIADQIIWTTRLPRAVLAVVVGAGLAVSGAVIQAVVRNPLGDPYLIGVVPGAGLGAVTVIVLGASATAGLSLSAAAFVGALVAFALTFLLGRRHGHWPPARLVLAGVAVGYLVSAVTYFLQTIATPNQVTRVLFWSLGSVSSARWEQLPLPTVVVAAATIGLVLQGRRLNALANGVEMAGALGIAVGRFQFGLMLVVALMTGTLVAVSGGILFVGLVVPHVARLLVGAEHRRMLLCSVLLGAVFLPLADIAARTVRAPVELPIGIVTAALGAPFFLWLLRSSHHGSR